MRQQMNESRQHRRRERRELHRGQQNPPNLGSARSDYGERAYGGRLNKEGMGRSWWDKTSDEVSAWFGDERAERRRRMDARNNRNRERNDRSQNYERYPFRFNPIESAYYPPNVDEQDWHDLTARDVMSTNVTTVHPTDAVTYAAELMGDCDCGAIPVVDWQGRMVGMVTDRDITIRIVANGMNPAYAQVSDCMTNKAFACHVNDSLENCMRSMSRHQIRRIPIVDDYNRIVGIVSQADVARHAAENRGRGERRAVSNMICAVSKPTSSSYS